MGQKSEGLLTIYLKIIDFLATSAILAVVPNYKTHIRLSILISMKKYFNELGFDENEVLIIETLINHQQLTAPRLQEEIGIAKSTLFRVLAKLKKIGIVAHDFKRHHNTYRLASPQSLVNLVSRKRRKFRRLELELEELLYNLKRHQNKTTANIEVYYNPEQFLALTERSLLAQNKKMYDFGNLDALREVISADFDEQVYIPERIQKKIFLYMLTYHTPQAKSLQERDRLEMRETRLISEIEPINSYWKVYDNTLIIYSNIKERFVICVQSPTLAGLFRHMFKIMWQAT